VLAHRSYNFLVSAAFSKHHWFWSYTRTLGQALLHIWDEVEQPFSSFAFVVALTAVTCVKLCEDRKLRPLIARAPCGTKNRETNEAHLLRFGTQSRETNEAHLLRFGTQNRETNEAHLLRFGPCNFQLRNF
jgi:hypothetical protein